MKFNKEKILKKNTVVHCPEEWMAEELLAWADSEGMTWQDGAVYEKTKTNWDEYCKDTCYNLLDGWFGVYGEISRKILNFEDVVEKELIEIVAGIDATYSNDAELVARWAYGLDYKKDCSVVSLSNIRSIYEKITLRISVVGEEVLSIEEANKILEPYGFVVVEKPRTIVITADDGQKLEVSVEKAKELGFAIK